MPSFLALIFFLLFVWFSNLIFIFFFSFLWFSRTARLILFWLYLWQLKEYHIGRFLDHFNTEKGGKLLFNPLNIFKIILIALFFALPVLFLFLLLIIYLLEFFKIIIDISKRRIKRPVFTKKSLLLILLGGAVETIFLITIYYITKDVILFALYLLIFDIFTPIIVSIIVFLMQPFAVLGRNQIIKKAKKKREQFSAHGGSASDGKDLLVVGITGSYGKTSTKEFLYTILKEKFGENKVLKTKAHQNSEVGISQCILNDLKSEHEIFICEMGAYNRGGIKLLCDIVKPKIGILTGINEQHMSTFWSQNNVIKTKFELIEALPEDGVAVFNGDNAFIKFKIKNSIFKVINKKLYSAKDRTDIWAEDINTSKEFVTFRVLTRDNDSIDFKVNVLGTHNVLNILGAVTVAKELGMSLSEIAKACGKIDPKNSGMQLKQGANGLNIIDSTYSANPDGVISALEYLKLWEGKKVIVMPCLIELGFASKEVHRRIGKKIGEVCDLAIITTKERFKEIKEGAVFNGGEKIFFIEDPKEIFEKLKSFLGGDLSSEALAKEDVVLLESRVPSKLISWLVSNKK